MPRPSSAPTCAVLAPLQRLEAELGIPVYDSIATTLWKSLQMAGVDPARVRGWGQLFSAINNRAGAAIEKAHSTLAETAA